MTKLFIDTSGLKYYQDSQNNYCHFVLGNLLEIYVVLKKKNLLHDDLQITVNNPTSTFFSFYRIFSNSPVRLAVHSEDADLILKPQGICDWRPESVKEREEMSSYFSEFCEYVIQKLNLKPSKIRQITLIRRNPYRGIRYLINYSQIEKALRRFCQAHEMIFQSVDFEGLDFHEQVQIMINTSILIGVHGAGIFNCFFLQEGSSVIELYPHPSFKGGKFPFICEKKKVHYIGFLNPTWSIPTLYNLLLTVIRKGHLTRSKFYRDRNILVNPEELMNGVQQAFDRMRLKDQNEPPINRYIDRPSSDPSPISTINLLAQHKKFFLALGLLVITIGWTQSFGFLSGTVTLLLALSFFF